MTMTSGVLEAKRRRFLVALAHALPVAPGIGDVITFTVVLTDATARINWKAGIYGRSRAVDLAELTNDDLKAAALKIVGPPTVE